MQRQAFSLSQLLVVVAIIAVLFSLTITAIASVRESARRITCMNNLRQWGVALLVAAKDNRGALLPSPWDPTFPRAAPCYMPINPPVAYLGAYDGQVAGEFTLTRMADYMEGGERVLQVFQQAKATATSGWQDLPVGAFSSWRCPSQRGGFYFQAGSSFGPLWSDFVIGMGYSYFARTDLWDKYMGNNQMFSDPAWKTQLSGRLPNPNGVLMNDTLWYWTFPGFMGPNHIKSMGVTDVRGDVRAMAGNNTLYGDARVEWKPAAAFDLQGMMDPANDKSTIPHTHPAGHGESWDFW